MTVGDVTIDVVSPRKRIPTGPSKATAPGTLVGVAEIAELAGVSRQRVIVLAKRLGFPAPVVELRMGKVWKANQVKRWLETYRREQE